MPGCYHLPSPYTHRKPFTETNAGKLAQLCLQALEDKIAFQEPSTIAVFIMEPVLGPSGVIPPHPSFMPGEREICSHYGILLLHDEVITAFGRLGSCLVRASLACSPLRSPRPRRLPPGTARSAR